MNEKKKIPVIIDTDIGDDIDDTWALVFALLSESLDIKLVQRFWATRYTELT